MRPRGPLVARRGLSLLELLLALAITAMMGVAVASMLSMAGTVAQSDREGRSLLLRAHAGQARLRAYLDPALCVLQQDDTRNGLCIWLHDSVGPESVNLTEMRALWFDPVERTIKVERVEFSATWPEATKQAADVLVPTGTDYLSVILAQRALGFTKTQLLVDRVWTAAWAPTLAQKSDPVSAAKRVRLTTLVGVDDTKATEIMLAFGLVNHRAPTK